MRYYLDCEFDGWQGHLLSMALVSEEGGSLSMVFPQPEPRYMDDWVKTNVVPYIGTDPYVTHCSRPVGAEHFAALIAEDPHPVIVADWPDDIKYLCDLLVTGPGRMVRTTDLIFEIRRVDAYPTRLMGMTQHNAWCDAMALRHHLTGRSDHFAAGAALPRYRP